MTRSAGDHALTELLPGLYATSTAPLPFMSGVVVRSFVLSGDDAPVIIYNSPGIGRAAEEISTLGTPERLLVNHWHEEMYGAPGIDVPAFVHVIDHSQTEPRLPIAGTFEGRLQVTPSIEAIPTPGHTLGATVFLWRGPEHRVLFTGDSLWDNRGRWEAVVLGESDRASYLESLELMTTFEFDVVAPWVAFDDAEPVTVLGSDEARARIDDIISRLKDGENA